jgi:hypothetical protein
MARHFKLIGAHAINVLARLAAQNAVKEQLRDQGVRLSLVPIRDITEKAQRYLADHPELYQQALERARRMGWVDLQPPMVTPDTSPPVTQSDNAKSGTEKTQLFSTTSAIFSGWRLLITY